MGSSRNRPADTCSVAHILPPLLLDEAHLAISLSTRLVFKQCTLLPLHHSPRAVLPTLHSVGLDEQLHLLAALLQALAPTPIPDRTFLEHHSLLLHSLLLLSLPLSLVSSHPHSAVTHPSLTTRHSVRWNNITTSQMFPLML